MKDMFTTFIKFFSCKCNRNHNNNQIKIDNEIIDNIRKYGIY